MFNMFLGVVMIAAVALLAIVVKEVSARRMTERREIAARLARLRDGTL